jgi:hypothetical protein
MQFLLFPLLHSQKNISLSASQLLTWFILSNEIVCYKCLNQSQNGFLLACCHSVCRKVHDDCFVSRREQYFSESLFSYNQIKRRLFLHRSVPMHRTLQWPPIVNADVPILTFYTKQWTLMSYKHRLFLVS